MAFRRSGVRSSSSPPKEINTPVLGVFFAFIGAERFKDFVSAIDILKKFVHNIFRINQKEVPHAKH